MKNSKNIFLTAGIIVGFLLLSLMYFSPIIKGKVLQQHDVMTYHGASKELKDYKDTYGESTDWTNTMFSGMPTCLIESSHKSFLKVFSYIFYFQKERPFMLVFMYFLFAFIAFILIDMSLLISLIGAIAYGLSSYLFIIIEAGHITKCVTLSYMPVIIAGVYAAYNGKRLIGSIFFTLFLALQIKANHLQITYYTFMVIFVFVLMILYRTFRNKNLKKGFVYPSLFLIVGVILSIGANFTNLYQSYDYGKYSIRGKSELTSDIDNKTSGLDRDYATAWSYGIDETFTLIVPNMKGGASTSELSTDSEVYKELESRRIPNAKSIIKNLPTYWGDQPYTSGPVYIGIIVFFLFVLGLFLIKGYIKWWLVSITIISIFLAWGHNFMPFTDLFFDYVPGYNKFRTVAMTLVIAGFTMPLLGMFALKEFIENEDKSYVIKNLKYAFYTVAGLLVVLLFVAKSIYTYESASDAQLMNAGWPDFLINAIRSDRESLLTSDIFRSIFFLAASFGVMILYKMQKLKTNLFFISLALLVLVDLWVINKRYLNNDDFVSKRKTVEAFTPTDADLQILQDKDPNFRVMNLSVSTFNDASTSYYHKSIGGYHGAKMRRYQELIDHYISKMDMNVLNMLNTKYFIIADKQTNKPVAQRNPNAYGNAWFVNNIEIVANADEEIEKLGTINPRNTAIVNERFGEQITKTSFNSDNSSIKLESYKPNNLVYKTNTSEDQFAVFSEIYFANGWQAFIDGNPVSHIQVNYVLRAMNIPAGEHTIEFKFKYANSNITTMVSYLSSGIILLLLIYFLYSQLVVNRKKD